MDASRIVDSLDEGERERETEEEEEEEGRKKRAEVRRSEGSRERRRIRGGWSFVKDCRQFPQGLVASGPPNKLFRGWATLLIFHHFLNHQFEWMLEAYVKGLRSIRGGKETRERTWNTALRFSRSHRLNLHDGNKIAIFVPGLCPDCAINCEINFSTWRRFEWNYSDGGRGEKS